MALSFYRRLLVGRTNLIPRTPSLARRLFFILFWLSCCVLCLSLSSWQFQRLTWKNTLIRESIQKRKTLLPVSHLQDNAEQAFYQVQLKGTFQHASEHYLWGRLHHGKLGVHVLTPFIISKGPSILVNRGWTSHTELKTFWRPLGEISLEGYLMAPPKPSFWTPVNDPQTQTWHWIELSKLMPKGFQHLYVIATREEGHPTAPHTTLLDFPNNHLQYALTWLALAGGIFVLGVFWLRFYSLSARRMDAL